MNESDQFNDEVSNPPLKKVVGIWSDRPRFLGIFEHRMLPAQNSKVMKDKVPAYGIAHLLVTCPGCAAGAAPHPVLSSIGIYVKIGRYIVTASWPTWLRIP